MREIKFRAWNEASGNMLSQPFNGRIGSLNEVFSETINFIYMQYTGLKDKNGVEIYEGDIVLSDDADFESRHSMVDWNNETASFYFEKWCESLESTEDIEIVGNIYENPELLDKECKQ